MVFGFSMKQGEKSILVASLFVILVLLLGHLAQFWKFYLLGLLPFPGDTLVAFYFPWSSGGFPGFDPFTQYKAQNTVDVIKQMFPWRDFAFEMIAKGQWPLWNPYSFSGMPLIANLQSAVFFPGHALSLFISSIAGWITIVVGELLFFGWTSYLFLRSQKLSQVAAAFGALVSMGFSYLALWHAQLVITESLLFLPLILTLVNRYISSKKPHNLLLVSFLFTFCLFGGHAQTIIYVYLIFFLFALYRRVALVPLIVTSLLPALLAAVQLLPSLEAYMLSAREGQASKELFGPFIFQWKQMITVVAPDFFGHPTTRNFWGRDYRDFNTYFGVTAFVFSLTALFSWHRFKDVKFFAFLAGFGLLLATWPLVFVFDILSIPILSSGVPARMMFLFQYGGVILSAYGLEAILREDHKNLSSAVHRTLFVVVLVIVAIWVVALGEQVHFAVTRNNLVLPTAMLLITSLLIFLRFTLPKFRAAIIVTIFGLVIVQSTYFFEKYTAFSPVKFTFPTHPVITFLKQSGGINRFFGVGNAYFNYDFSVYYRLYDIQGYDSLYPKRYGEFSGSTENNGKIPEAVMRSDAVFHPWSESYTKRAFDLLGAKYLLEKDDDPVQKWTTNSLVFHPAEYNLVWQQDKWKIYERYSALPRVALMDSYIKRSDKQAILDALYEDAFPYRSTLVLEQDPKITPQKALLKTLTILSYTPNEIQVKTQSDAPQLLYLSDNFYPGWYASVDGKDSPIYRANYTFRAVALPAGEHQVRMSYAPLSFSLGLVTSLISAVLATGVLGYLLLRDRHLGGS